LYKFMKEYKIDAKNKSLGRVASEAAKALRGKNEADFKDNVAPDIKVMVSNVNDLKITGLKMDQKIYKRYSGYPGGLKEMVMSKVVEKKGKAYIFEKAVKGMLPKNKLQKQMMKNLIIS